MSLIRPVLPALAASVLAMVTFAAGAEPAAPPPPANPACAPMGGGYRSVMNFLTPEERLMHFAEVHKATEGMSFDQMRAYRMSERNKVMAMSADERQKYADGLKAKWEALPADQKANLQQQFATWRANHPRGMGHGMGGGGMGPGPGCP